MASHIKRNLLFSDNLFKLRTKENLSQDKLASQFNVSKQSVGNWETRKNMPDLEMLIELSEFFDVTLDDLLFSKKILEKIRTREESIERLESVMDKMNDGLSKMEEYYRILKELDKAENDSNTSTNS